MRFALFLLALSLSSALAQTTVQYSMEITDTRKSTEYTGGATEFHCVDFLSGTANYVRGTFGLYAYFEGTISGSTATVTVIDSMQPSKPYTAVFNYADGFTSVSGNFTNGATKSWTSTKATSTPLGTPDIYRDCMWGNMGKTAAFSGSFESAQGKVFMCETSGKVAGSYNYAYSASECKDNNFDCSKSNIGKGYYDKTVQTLNVGKTSKVFSTNWYEPTGPSAGVSGGNLYVMTPNSSATTDPIHLRGFYCNVVDGKRTFCSVEDYSIVSTTPANSSCEANYPTATVKTSAAAISALPAVLSALAFAVIALLMA